MSRVRSQAALTKLDRIIKTVCTVCAVCSLVYYLGIGFFAGFGVSLLFVWLLLAVILLAFGHFFPALRDWWNRKDKWLKFTITGAVALILLVVLILFGAVLSGFVSDIPEGESVDCIIVLGAQVKVQGPSLALAHRIETAYNYLATHPDTVAIASGGQGTDEPISEARCIYDSLVAMGISSERIILEERSTSTAENLQFSAALIPDTCETVAIVTNNFHAFRGQCTARKYLPDTEVYRLPAEFHLYMLPHYLVREIAAFTVDTLRGNLSFH